MGKMRNITFWTGKLNGRDYAEDLGVDGKVILEWILGKWVKRCGLDESSSEQIPMAG